MNIYQKLQEARVKLQGMAINKSGNNKFAGYTYMELGDFLPAINNIMKEQGLCSFINFMPDLAILTIINTEKTDEQIQFTSPMSTAQLKGCHDVQNLGAVQTYLRRYLYINAFEIVEHDALDALTGKDDKPPHKPAETPKSQGNTNGLATISEAQAKRMFSIGKGNTEAVKKVLQSHGYTESKAVKKPEYETICKEIEKAVS